MKTCARQKKTALLARQRWQEARRALALAGMLTFVGVSALGQTYWDGGGDNSTWNSSNNWSNNTTPNNNTTDVVLDNSLVATVPTISLSNGRTVRDLTFGATNNFSLSGSVALTLAGGDLIRTSGASGTQTIGVTTLTLSAAANAFNIGGSGSLVINSIITGAGTITKSGSGTVAFNNSASTFSGGLIINAGTLLVGPTSGNVGIAAAGGAAGNNSALGRQGIVVNGGTLEIAPTGSGADFTGFSRSITNNGGIIKLNPNDEITGIMNAGTLTFGTSGGTLDIAKRLSTTAGLGNVAVNSVSNTPAIISYGTIANTSGAGGWDTAGRELTVTNSTLSGTGHLQFALTNGAMVNYRQTNFSGTLYFNGPSTGDASAGSTDTDVGRLLLNPSSGSTYQVAGGIYFDGYMQVMSSNAVTLDANLTIRSGQTAFQGAAGTNLSLTIGSSDTDTLTIRDDARAIMDVAFRTDNNTNGSVNLQSSTTIEAGGTLQFKRSNTSSVEGQINVSGNITGQGNSTNESTVFIDTAATDGTGTAAGRTFFQSTVDLAINGSGTGGLRIEGASTNVNSLLTTSRINGLTGTGGTLTIAYTDSVTNTFNTDPTSPSNIKLGFDAGGSGDPTYWLGSANNDLTTFAGLVVRGGTVVVNRNQEFTGNSSTTLDMLGGDLILKRVIPTTLTFKGNANLTGGTIHGGGGEGGGSGALIVGGDVISDGTVLETYPNLTMTAGTGITNTLRGSTALEGVGTFTKGGDGRVILEQELGAVSINVQAGTLLLDSANRISDTANMTLSGGTFATGGNNETLGILTLTANSYIDLGGGSSTLNFSGSEGWTTGTTNYIQNWSGDYANGNGTDQLYIGDIDETELGQIFFVNPAGFDPGTYPAILLPSGEIVPIPEPGTWLAIFALVSAIGYRERRRIYTFSQMWFRRPEAK